MQLDGSRHVRQAQIVHDTAPTLNIDHDACFEAWQCAAGFSGFLIPISFHSLVAIPMPELHGHRVHSYSHGILTG